MFAGIYFVAQIKKIRDNNSIFFMRDKQYTK